MSMKKGNISHLCCMGVFCTNVKYWFISHLQFIAHNYLKSNNSDRNLEGNMY